MQAPVRLQHPHPALNFDRCCAGKAPAAPAQPAPTAFTAPIASALEALHSLQSTLDAPSQDPPSATAAPLQQRSAQSRPPTATTIGSSTANAAAAAAPSPLSLSLGHLADTEDLGLAEAIRPGQEAGAAGSAPGGSASAGSAFVARHLANVGEPVTVPLTHATAQQQVSDSGGLGWYLTACGWKV